MGHLGADMECQVLPSLVPDGGTAPGLDGNMGLAPLRKETFHVTVCAGNSALEIAGAEDLVRHQIRRQTFIDQWRSFGEGGFNAGHGFERLIIDKDYLGGVFR